ncbi:lycopene beta-cyclase CrtY [Ramlibacter aurantiacus]|uniref:lycopene beta-cyclase CrtY n=1 Tax=Ramlibacter aurantiacus TaxID=2801330 RepID=UPI00338E983A
MSPTVDLVLAGGGLANILLAWRLRTLRPQLRLLVLEAGPTLGGNHTWSFHAEDLTPAQHAWIEPLVQYRWPGYRVRFPARERQLEGGYFSITSQRLHAQASAVLGDALRLRTPVARVEPTRVHLSDGTVVQAAAVVDGRGFTPSRWLRLGWQKFVGHELRLARPHGLAMPVLMDATVPQAGGLRFVYTLPLDEHTVLVEDTAYADGSALDVAGLRCDIDTYVRSQGWTPLQVLREEQGVLPIVLSGDAGQLWQQAAGVPRVGLAAGLFHPTTGYALPDAVRVADLVSALPELSAEPLFQALRGHALAQWRRQGFFRMLNRMLFEAAAPHERRRVMERFYGLPAPLIARFYAGRPTAMDKLRVLSGKPPVALRPALRAALDQAPPAARSLS